jgi:hypothetical protein
MMCRVQLSHGIPPRPVHDAWIARALTDIGNAPLRDAMLGSDRFADRIVEALLDCAFGPGAAVVGDDQVMPLLAMLVERLDEAFARRVGLLWFAPRLAGLLLDAKRRDVLGLNDRAEVQCILRYRAHAAASIIGTLPEHPNYVREGAACIAVWLDTCGQTGLVNRIRLTLPPDIGRVTDHHPQRAALVENILNDAKRVVSP